MSRPYSDVGETVLSLGPMGLKEKGSVDDEKKKTLVRKFRPTYTPFWDL